MAELEGGEAVPGPTASPVVQSFKLLLGLVHPLGGHGGADPQADTEGLLTPDGGVLATGELGGAYEGGGALELLGGEQAQGVAHEDGDAGTPVDGSVGGLEESLAAADGEGIGSQSQVGLSLASTGGEEEELCGSQVAGAARQGGVSEGRQLHEDEGELEDTPVVGVAAGQDAGLGLLDAEAGVDGADGGDLGANALVGHDPVHEGEAAAGLGTGQEVVDALGELVTDLESLGEGLGAGIPQVLRQRGDGDLLLPQPGRVCLHDGFQGGTELCGVLGLGHGGQGAHIELGCRDGSGRGLGRLHSGHPGSADLEGAAGCTLAGQGLPHAPVDRAGASDGELEAVAVLELEAGLLRVGGRLRAGSRWEEGVVDGEEDVPASRIHMDLGLEHPGMDRNAAGRDLVIAQGELDKVTPTRPAGR